MFRARRTAVLLTTGLWLTLAGCNTPEAVSKFCTVSNTTLTAAVPVFLDLRASCLREKNIAKGIGAFAVVERDPNCDDIGKMAEGASAAADILGEYFDAINSVATFDKAKTSADASALVSKTGAAVGAGSLAQKAIGSMASFLTAAATSGYQQRSLNHDIVVVSSNIGVVTDALAAIVQRNYIDQELKAEEQKLTTEYKEFALLHREGEVTLELDSRWHTERQTIAAKRASALHLITALHAIKKGSANLAEKSHSLKAKELPGLLDPYITQLQTLIPQIQKAF